MQPPSTTLRRVLVRVGREAKVWPGLAIAALLAACGGGGWDGGGGTAVTTTPPACAAGSDWDGSACVSFAERSVERMPTPWIEQGVPLTLELVVYRPLGSAGPRPVLVFHHGSTGNGDDPAAFRITFESQALAREFTTRGFVVLFPQRRGRGQSDGVYDEGFDADRSRYACTRTAALPGLERALQDAEVINQQVRLRPDIDPSRTIVGGFSRGGLIALMHAARTPAVYRGVINFVGGWLGQTCVDAGTVNRIAAVQAAAGAVPGLWLYGENDPFYTLTDSRGHLDSFVQAGGRGRWLALRRADPAASGHLVHTEPALWQAAMTDFMGSVLP